MKYDASQLSALSDVIFTTSQRSQFLGNMRMWTSSFFDQTKTDRVSPESYFSQQVADVLKTIFPLTGAMAQDSIAVGDFSVAVTEYFHSLPVITITVAVEISLIFTKSLVLSTREKLRKPVLFEVVVNPYLIGGMIINGNGIYKDYSIKQKVSELPLL